MLTSSFCVGKCSGYARLYYHSGARGSYKTAYPSDGCTKCNGAFNDEASSISITSSDCKARIYSEHDCRGDQKDFYGYHDGYYVGNDFNDRAGSFITEYRGCYNFPSIDLSFDSPLCFFYNLFFRAFHSNFSLNLFRFFFIWFLLLHSPPSLLLARGGALAHIIPTCFLSCWPAFAPSSFPVLITPFRPLVGIIFIGAACGFHCITTRTIEITAIYPSSNPLHCRRRKGKSGSCNMFKRFRASLELHRGDQVDVF
jgi:hypothetical protein